MTKNLALGRPTDQLSTLGTFDSSKAVDGNSDGVLAHGSCSHTVKPKPAFWQVDLQKVYDIGEVVITGLGERKCEYKSVTNLFDCWSMCRCVVTTYGHEKLL